MSNKEPLKTHTVDQFELSRLYYTRDVQGLEVLLIKFSVDHNLLQYVEKHKKISIEQANKFIPIGKDHDLSLGDTNRNILLRTQQEILKDFPDLDRNHPPAYIKDWALILNCYASCFFLPELQGFSSEEKRLFREELKIRFLQNPLFFVEGVTFNKLANGTTYRAAADLNPANMERYFFRLFQNICQTTNINVKEKLSNVMSEKVSERFMRGNPEAIQLTLRAMQLFVELFSLRMEEKIHEICEETFSLLNLDMHRDEKQDLQDELKEKSFNDLLEKRKIALQAFLRYKPKEEKRSYNGSGRPKTYTPLSFLQEIIEAAKKLGETHQLSEISKNKIAEQMGIQRSRLNERLEETGIDDQTFYNLIQQAISLK